MAVDEAHRSRDPGLRKRAAALIARADELTNAYEQIKPSLETLRAGDDPAAHLAVGKFLCLAKGDWPAGLPHLAKGNGEVCRRWPRPSCVSSPTRPSPLPSGWPTLRWRSPNPSRAWPATDSVPMPSIGIAWPCPAWPAWTRPGSRSCCPK